MRTLLNTKQAAELLGVRPSTLRDWRWKGVGPPFHRLGIGPKAPIRYDLATLDAWLNEGQRSSTSDSGKR